jgi:hypothetical protein
VTPQPTEQNKTSEVLSAPDAPLALSINMPEPLKPVKEPDAAAAMVPLKEETRTAAVVQADQFISDLLQMDVTSGDFRSRVDSAFRLGRKEIGDSALLTGKFMEKSFVGDADNPAFKVMNEMRGLFESLDPGKEGDLFSTHKILGLIPFGNRLKAYLQRFDSASSSIGKLIDNIYGVEDELTRDDQELFATMNKLLAAMTKLKAVDVFIERLDQTLTEAVAKLRATDPARAKAIEQEVLFYARQASMDVEDPAAGLHQRIQDARRSAKNGARIAQRVRPHGNHRNVEPVDRRDAGPRPGLSDESDGRSQTGLGGH